MRSTIVLQSKRWGRLLASALALVGTLSGPTPVTAGEDFPIPGGRFFTHREGPAGWGYAVLDDDAAPMLTCFQQLGGVAELGRPISGRFATTSAGGDDDGAAGPALQQPVIRQAFANGIAQWEPLEQRCTLAPVLAELAAQGRDGEAHPVSLLSQPTEDVGASADEVAASGLFTADIWAASVAGDADLASWGPDKALVAPPDPLGLIALAKGLVPLEAALARPPLMPSQAATGTPRVVIGSAGVSSRVAAAALDGANRAAALLVPRYRLGAPPETVIRLYSEVDSFIAAALAFPEVTERDRGIISQRCAAWGRDYRTGGFTIVLQVPCGQEASVVASTRRRAAWWYAAIVHQAAGPHWSLVPAWFAAGLAWHEGSEAIQSTGSGIPLLSLASLPDLSGGHLGRPDADTWEQAHRQAIDAVGKLRTQFGIVGPATILHWAQEIGFARAFVEVTGMTQGQFEATLSLEHPGTDEHELPAAAVTATVPDPAAP